MDSHSPLMPPPASAAADWPNQMIEVISEPMLAVDTDWRITYLNRAAADTFSSTPAALVGRILWEAFPTLEASPFGPFYRRVMETGCPDQMENFSQSTQRWYAVRAAPLAAGLFISFQDIHTRKLVEAKLSAQTEHLRLLAEITQTMAQVAHQYDMLLDQAVGRLASAFAASCSISLVDTDGQQLRTVAAHSAAHEPTAAASIDNADLCMQAIRSGKALINPAPLQYGLIIVPLRAQGHSIGALQLQRQIASQPLFSPDDLYLAQDLADRVALAIANALLFKQLQHELAQRQRAEDAQRASEVRFASIVDTAMDAIISVDASLRVVVFNSAAEQMFRCPAESAIGQPLDRFLPESARHIHPQHIRHFNEMAGITNQSMHAAGALTACRTTGEEFPIEGTISQTQVAGQPLYTVIIRDISERAQLEAQLVQAQKMESIGRLAGGIAHDFNNLLTAMLGYSAIVLTDLPADSPTYADIREIQLAAERAAALTHQLLAFSRQQMLQPQVISVNTVVNTMEPLLRRTIGEDIDLHTMLAPTLGHILADPHQIEQVVMNLVVNARDALPHGGHITIETLHVELDESYRAHRHPEVKTGPYVMLAVSDNGIGMDAATQTRIFDPFFTTKELGRGTGLGLASVYGIVHQSGGYIWVYSELGVGTTFKIYFPHVQAIEPQESLLAANHTAPPIALDPAALPQHGRILVVEDDALVRTFIQRVLYDAGYTPLLAEHGVAALELLSAEHGQVDLVLTDMVMPQMGGRPLIEQIKQTYAHIAILCMSGYTDQVVMRHNFFQWCDHFLEKPFTPRTLCQHVAMAIAATHNN